MKYFLLLFIFFIIAINTLYTGELQKIDTPEDAYKKILKENQALIDKTKNPLPFEQSITIAEPLSKLLIQSKDFLVGDKIHIFLLSKEDTQSKFIAALRQSGYVLIEAAVTQARFNLYHNSTALLESQNIPSSIFLDIANNIEENINTIIQKYTAEKSSIVFFKNIYHLLVYHWLLYYACETAQTDDQLPSLANIITKSAFHINDQDKILMSILNDEYQILT